MSIFTDISATVQDAKMGFAPICFTKIDLCTFMFIYVYFLLSVLEKGKNSQNLATCDNTTVFS